MRLPRVVVLRMDIALTKDVPKRTLLAYSSTKIPADSRDHSRQDKSNCCKTGTDQCVIHKRWEQTRLWKWEDARPSKGGRRRTVSSQTRGLGIVRKQTRDTNHQDEGGNADQKQVEEKSKRHYGLEVRRLISTNCTEGPKEPKGQKGQRIKKDQKGPKDSKGARTHLRLSAFPKKRSTVREKMEAETETKMQRQSRSLTLP